MKKRLLFLFTLCALLLSACGNQVPTITVGQPPTATGEAVTNAGGTVSIDLPEDYASPDGTAHGGLAVRPTGDVVEIGEKVFIAQTNDIYLNPQDYVGRTIKYEGLYQAFYWEEEDLTYHYIIRYGPGCCGTDGNAGFEVVWDGDWPQPDDWVEAVGVLEVYDYGGWPFLQIRLDTLTVLDERGAEYVQQ